MSRVKTITRGRQYRKALAKMRYFPHHPENQKRAEVVAAWLNTGRRRHPQERES